MQFCFTCFSCQQYEPVKRVKRTYSLTTKRWALINHVVPNAAGGGNLDAMRHRSFV